MMLRLRRSPSLLHLLVLVAVLAFCACKVLRFHRTIHARTEPPGAEVTMDGARAPGNRWNVPPNTKHKLVATWPDGTEVEEYVIVRGDVNMTINKEDADGDDATGGEDVATSGEDGVGDESPADGSAEARRLYEEGKRSYELADYAAAIEKFKKAYALMRDQAGASEILVTIMYNLAVAYEKSYEVAPKIEQLRRAREMYKRYDQYKAQLVEGWPESDEHLEVLGHVRRINARIEELESGAKSPSK